MTTTKTTGFVVFSQKEFDSSGKGFWNVYQGWERIEEATVYPNIETFVPDDLSLITLDHALAINAIGKFIGKQGQYNTPYESMSERNGQTFSLLGYEPPEGYDSLDCGVMYNIEFADGTKTKAWPEEVESVFATVPDAAAPAQPTTESATSPLPQPENHAYRCGYYAAIRGFSIQPPSHLRKRVEMNDFQKGWLAGQRVRTSMLEGQPKVQVSDYVATPRPKILSDGSITLEWNEPRSGKDFTSPELARVGLQALVDRDATLQWLNVEPAGCPA